MITPDANLLIYAYNENAEQHERAKQWLEKKLSSPELFGLSWQVVTAFLRISTNVRVFSLPFTLPESMEIVEKWLAQPQVKILLPTEKHWKIFSDLIIEGQTGGALMMDAHLAALAIEHGAILATTDRDFVRFSKLKTMNPLLA
ncbi:MAG: type II toxin-antitoxin system VapC family toxin [Pyrinomonadaceae bacterium]|nr:type II toxin-antitoxin system VapC family toxin [Pyrinomonadaceae bacterium]